MASRGTTKYKEGPATWCRRARVLADAISAASDFTRGRLRLQVQRRFQSGDGLYHADCPTFTTGKSRQRAASRCGSKRNPRRPGPLRNPLTRDLLTCSLNLASTSLSGGIGVYLGK